MHDLARRLRSFFSELKRRKIFRAAVIYASVTFVVLQAADIVFPALYLPSWALTLLVVVTILGFPLVLALEWVFEITSEGMRREPSSDQDALQTRRASGAQLETGVSAAGQLPDVGAGPVGGSPWRRPMLLVPAAVVLIFALASAWGLRHRQPDPEPTLAATAVAVLPFSVRGGEDARYLGEGIVNLLGTALDGAGPLRAIDARAMFGVLAQEGGGTPDPERGRRLAARLGAGLFVLGDIVQAGDRFHVEAAVYAATAGAEPLTHSAVSGRSDALFELVDELAARLIAGLGDAPGDRLTRTAAVTTSSFAAFKAYLDGETHVRTGEFERAAEAYQQAIAHDSTFAVAYYRLALARDWASLPGFEEAARAAARHAARLSPRDRALVESLQAYHSGDAPEAERRYRAILARYPDDLEAWYTLAEVLFHFGPLHGRSLAGAEEAWFRVLSYEPRNLWGYVHLGRILAVRGRVAALDSLLARFTPQEITADRRLLQIGLLRAIAARDTATAVALASQARDWEDGAVIQLGTYLTAFSPDPAGARRVIRSLIEPHRGPVMVADRQWLLTLLHLANGEWAAARAERARAVAALARSPSEWYHRSFDPVTEWWLVTLPLPYPDSMLQRVRRTAASVRLPAAEAAGTPSDWLRERIWFETLGPPPTPEALRHYTIGSLSVRLQDLPAAAAASRSLTALADAAAAGPLVRDLARGLRARIAWAGGDPGQALRLLEALELGPTNLSAVLFVPFAMRVHERYLRGELLAALGRDEEALPWFASLGELSELESVLRAPVHLRQAEIHERLGNSAEAGRHYTRFVDLWAESDPEFRPLVEQARRRLGSLR